jgi:hypothetical protein
MMEHLRVNVTVQLPPHLSKKTFPLRPLYIFHNDHAQLDLLVDYSDGDRSPSEWKTSNKFPLVNVPCGTRGSMREAIGRSANGWRLSTAALAAVLLFLPLGSS